MLNKKQKLRKEADTLFQSKRQKLCKLCGKPASVVHHLIPKARSNAVRYDLMNAVSLCMGCHHLWHATQDPRLYEKMRPRNFKALEAKSRKIIRTNLAFYEEAIERLKP